MMKEVLRLVYEGGLISKTDIMDKLGIQESALEDIFSLLISKGYLKKIRNTDVSQDSMRYATSAFALRINVAVSSEYVITPKGKAYLKSK
jgi:hypothetical protein